MIIQPVKYLGNHPTVAAGKPYRARGTAAHRNKLYAACLKAAADPGSELFHRDSRSGIFYRHTGASHRCAFWAGYDHATTGKVNRLLRGHPESDAAACYRAGQAFGRADLENLNFNGWIPANI